MGFCFFLKNAIEIISRRNLTNKQTKKKQDTDDLKIFRPQLLPFGLGRKLLKNLIFRYFGMVN